MAASPSRAGGRATEAGMAFQAGVGAWFAAHLVSEMPVGPRLGLDGDTVPTELQFETGNYVDDIALRLSDGRAVFIQCKTRPSLSAVADSPMASTIGQLVALFVSLKSGASSINPDQSAVILAVASDASGSLDNLEAACRFFDLGGRWADGKSRMNRSQARALDLFEGCVRASWNDGPTGPPTEEDLVALARLFHIVRFEVDRGGRDWREAASVVGSRLFGKEEAGEAPLSALSNAVRGLMRNGATANREGLINAIRAENLDDTQSPRFDRDIARLRALSRDEVDRLARHRCLPISGGIPIPRECMTSLRGAAESGSLLVVGEPGSGKTGVLVDLAGAKLESGAPVVFLSVDRLAGVTTTKQLQDELQLEYPLLDVLAGWPGRSGGFFFIDALDASRGGPSEPVFGSLLEDAVARLGERWSIIASIRTFDLQNGRRFRTIMAGTPPSPTFSEPGLEQVRHFRVPRLSEGEVRALAQVHPELGRLAETAPPSVRELLRNVFNLSLAAHLVAQGVPADSIRTVTTQSDLIDRYEDERLPTSRLQAAVAKTVQIMVERRRLAIPKITITHDALDDALNTGVLAAAGDRIAFAHHVLFDHAAGRFYLEWDDAERLKAQVTGDPAIGLLLGPGLRFAMERIWRDDGQGRPTTWHLIAAINSVQNLDPVVTSVALRTAAERVTQPEDVEALCDLLRARERIGTLGATLSRLARFVSVSIAEAGSIGALAATSWAIVAQVAVATCERSFVDGARFLLWTLFERGDFTAPTFATTFGKASRALLAFAWDADPPMPILATNAIRFVAKTFGTDPTASRVFLQRILEEPRFSDHAHDEAPWLAEGVPAIVPFDPEFATRIYAVLFGRPVPKEGETWMGGQPSRILALTSNRRQDYEHARWYLRKALPSFLGTAPGFGTRAVSAAAIGMAFERSSSDRSRETHRIQAGPHTLTIVEDDLSLQEWRGRGSGTADPEDDILVAFAKFLGDCAPSDFRTAVETATAEESATSVWARLLGIGADRPGIADEILWSVASTMAIIETRGICRDAITYLAATYPNQSPSERTVFERDLVARAEAKEQEESRRWRFLAARFLSLVPETALATEELRTLRATLDAEKRLVGNPPFLSIDTTWDGADDITDELLRESGVNLDEGPDQQVRGATRALDDLLRERKEAPRELLVARLWTAASRVTETIDQHVSPAPHPETLRASWGSVSNAIESITKADDFTPGQNGHPSLDTLLHILDRMAISPYPELREASDSGLMTWGNWDVRVYVASSLMALARRFANRDPTILDRLTRMLKDPVPAVRLQIAQSLNTLWDIARPAMWRMVDAVAREETNLGVLGFYIGGPLIRIAGAEPERCEILVGGILAQLPRTDGENESQKRNTLEEAVGHLAAQLWVGRGRNAARAWISMWTADLPSGQPYLSHLLSALRGALFERFAPTASAERAAIQDRARSVLHDVVVAAAEALVKATPPLTEKETPDAERKKAERLYKAGDRLLDHACNQLYFGSGAFRSREDEERPGLNTPETMRVFLNEYEATLDLIGRAGTARTIHHLIELYEYLVAAAPEKVFDRVADLLVGPAAREGYHFESLGSDVLVRLVRRYLADHRGVFDDQDRRTRLVRVLELFSSAGWPEALKLLYELPDLLR
jgi:hypothetical protein